MKRTANSRRQWPKPQQSLYCSSCAIYIGPSGERVAYEDPNLIVWTECERCLMLRLEREAAEEQRRREQEERTRPRQCELAECQEMFVPRMPWARFCSDRHRWVAYQRERQKAKQLAG